MDSCEVFDQETGQNSFETSEAEDEYELPTPITPRKTQTGTVIADYVYVTSKKNPSTSVIGMTVEMWIKKETDPRDHHPH